MSSRVSAESPSGATGLAAGSLVVWTLVPFGEAQRLFPALDLGLLIALAGLFGLALTLLVASATHGPRRLVTPRLEAATLWSACGLALLSAAAAVAASSQSLNLERIVLTQRHTSLFVLTQPAAASIYFVALALAGQRSVLAAALGPPSRARLVAELVTLTALGAVGGTLFLGGFAGATLPGPVWVLLKTLVVCALLVLVRPRFSGLTPVTRLALAWVASLLGMLNLAITLALPAT